MDPIAKQLHNQWLQTPETVNLLKTLNERREAFVRTATCQAVANQDIEMIRIFLVRAYSIEETIKEILTPSSVTDDNDTSET